MTSPARSETESRITHVQTENELLLAQLHHAQEELERQVLMNRSSQAHLDTVLEAIPAISAGQGRCLTLMNRLTDRLGLTIHHRVAFIDRSGYFDAEWYLAQYPDVASSGRDPIEHYLRHGASEERDPSPAFDTAWYLRRYPDVASAGMNPFYHYIRLGRAEGRQPAPDQSSGADISRVARAMRSLAVRIAEQAQQMELLGRAHDEQSALSASRLDHIDALEQALATQREQLEHTLAETGSERDAARAEAQQRQETIERLDQERTELEGQLFAGQAQIETLIQARDQQSALARDRQIEFEALTRAYSELEMTNAALATQREQLEQALKLAMRERDEQQRLVAQESALAEQHLAELKRWLLAEAQI